MRFVLWRTLRDRRKGLYKRFRSRLREHQTVGRAAELAYYFLLSIFPLFLVLLAFIGYLLEESSELKTELFWWLARLLPSDDARRLIEETLQEVIDERGGKLSFGLVVSLLVASQGLTAVGRVLNIAYGHEKRRRFPVKLLIHVTLTATVGLITAIGLILLLQGSRLVDVVAGHLRFGAFVQTLWSFGQWPVAFLFVLFGFDLVYNYTPARPPTGRSSWFSPGAVLGVTLWVASSYGLQAYLARFGLYSRTYGPLTAVIVLLVWLYFSGVALLIGGELNGLLARLAVKRRRRKPRSATARRGAPRNRKESKSPG